MKSVRQRQRDEVLSAHFGDTLVFKMARVRDEVIPAYIDIGPNGAFALSMMRVALDNAAKSMAAGDVVGMIAAYQDLKGFHT
jgi:hypothetical protein